MGGGRLPPVIKWPGSKRAVARQLAELIPHSDRYIEPFVGGGALLPHRVGIPAVAGDIIPELCSLWSAIRDRPTDMANAYEHRWTSLRDRGHVAFYETRDDFNRMRLPEDLLFLSRTCVNGLIRFNKLGDFNNSLHHTRPGISPARLRSVLLSWSAWIADVRFLAQDYRLTLADAGPGDFVFLDPPYAATKGRYQSARFEPTGLFEELERLSAVGAKWMLTYDGTAGERDYTVELPRDLFAKSFIVATGQSPFPRLQQARKDSVCESVFLNFEPVSEPGAQLFDVADQA